MTTRARKMIRAVLWLIGLYIGMMTAALAWITWSLVIDTMPPLSNIRGTLLSYDPETRIARIQWDATRNRFCPGKTVPKIMDGVIVALEEGIITGAGTSEDRRMEVSHPGEMGYPITWVREITVPPGVTGTARYVSVYYYSCNALQELRPLVVIPPEVEIQVGPEARLAVTVPRVAG